MGYNNNKNNNNKGGNNNKQRPSYFAQQVQRNGEQFFDKMNAKQMQDDSIRIFRDLARGNINLETELCYFENSMFIAAAIQGASTKYNLHYTHYLGTSMLIQSGNSTEDVIAVNSYDGRCAMAYSLILQTLQSIQQTKNISEIIPLANNLYNNYRYNI